MSRKRSISTDISIDSRINELSDFAALLYTWMIPHANDNCQQTARNTKELQMVVIPGRKKTVEQVQKALDDIVAQDLGGVDEQGHFYFHSESFYKYQTYINAEKRQETPRNTISPSSSPSSSPSLKEELNTSQPSDKAIHMAQLLSDRIYENYPHRTVPTEAQLMDWALEADRINHTDDHGWLDIENLLRWSQANSFWKANILSMAKFRKQWNQLLAKKAQEADNGQGSNRATHRMQEILLQGLTPEEQEAMIKKHGGKQ